MGASGTDVASTETPAPPRRPRFSLTAPADPGFAALRRAARAAIVIPPVLASASAIPARVGGWVMAGLISTLAGVVLWPRFERVMLRKQAAKACLAVAHLVEAFRANDRELPRLIEAARHAERAAREAYTATAKRPAGPTRRDRAFVQLLTELQRVVDIIERPFHQPRVSERPCLAEGDHLAAVTVAALRGSADVLTGGAPPDLRPACEAPDCPPAPPEPRAAQHPAARPPGRPGRPPP